MSSTSILTTSNRLTRTAIPIGGLGVPFVSSLFSINCESLLTDFFISYYKTRCNKRNTWSQARFERNLSANMMSLIEDVSTFNYQPGRHMCFVVNSPVKREIFAATFRDRIVHHYLYDRISPVFEPLFIFDSYSCRVGKGTHFGIERLQRHLRSCSCNGQKKCYALRLDISSYFMSIDKYVLWNIIEHHLSKCKAAGTIQWDDQYDYVMFLLKKIIFQNPTHGCRIKGKKSDFDNLPYSKSLFHAAPDCGLPIGNLTSQLFSNIYLNEFDQFIKRKLKFHYYGRYVDDSYIVDTDYDRLQASLEPISKFLKENLHLTLNMQKSRIYSVDSGVPFLGAIVMPFSCLANGRTLRKMRRLYEDTLAKSADKWEMRCISDSIRGYISYFSNKKQLKTYPYYVV